MPPAGFETTIPASEQPQTHNTVASTRSKQFDVRGFFCPPPHTHTHTDTHPHTHYTHTRARAHARERTRARTRTHTHTHPPTHTRTHTHTHTHTHIYIYIYIYIYIFGSPIFAPHEGADTETWYRVRRAVSHPIEFLHYG